MLKCTMMMKNADMVKTGHMHYITEVVNFDGNT